ncbi:hypothetical protein [Streptomyces sp. MI02-7b]|uniref:hypothetical protein n=1 Tax=Streptomyces sp. MI02-7b TaxID=462941 RepID=UPI0029B7448B|nr:hypothetical protein [Streptomyces sp. MI02-7b]MDX3074722.1 hypothetical protein [Streptomyces sp. MI02-7b]
MRRGLAHAGAWMLATSAAVAMSWFGVHHVLAGTAYDPPRALPLAEPAAASASPPPPSSATHRPRAPAGRPTTTAPATSPAAKPSASAPARPPGTPTPAASAAGTTGDVHSYPVEGGRVVLDLGADSATLVSATPEAGWEMKVWNQSASAWIRVDFTSGGTTSSLFCTWNGHPPTVETYKAGGQ